MIVEFSAALRRFVDGQEKVTASATTLSGLVEELSDKYPELNNTVITPNKEVMSFITLFIDGRNVIDASQIVEIPEGAVVSFVPSIAGG